MKLFVAWQSVRGEMWVSPVIEVHGDSEYLIRVPPDRAGNTSYVISDINLISVIPMQFLRELDADEGSHTWPFVQR